MNTIIETRRRVRRPNATRTAWQRFHIVSDYEPSLSPDEPGLAELVFSAPGITVLRGPGGYFVDREIPVSIPLNATSDYSVQRTRERLSRELALHRILTTVVPEQFHDLLKPLAAELQIADDTNQAHLRGEIV